ncbi:HK97 family phage portal protein [Bradyrhizobium elkanii]
MFDRLKNIFGFGQKSLYDPASWQALIDFGAQTAAGILVSPRLADRCPAVNAGKRIRCETLATLSLKMYRRTGDASEEATDHPLYQLLHDRPNGWTSATEFIGSLENDVIDHGHGYAFANRVNGKIIELIRLDPTSVAVTFDLITMEPTYRVTLSAGPQREYSWRDILHISSWNKRSAVRDCAEAIGLAVALERHAARILGNGARPSGVIKAKNKLTDVAYARLKKSWRNEQSGESAGGTAILEDGAEFEALTFSSVDLQFQEMRNFQILEIGRALGIPPTLLYELGRATWANAEEMGQAFLSFTMLGRCKLWEGAISRLLTEEEQATLYPEFLTDTLVRADLAARFEAFAKACGGPWMAPDEVRAIDNMGPIDGGATLRPPANAVGVTPDNKPAVKPNLQVAA